MPGRKEDARSEPGNDGEGPGVTHCEAGQEKKPQNLLDSRFFLLNCDENVLKTMAATAYSQQQEQQSQGQWVPGVSVCV